MTTSDTEVSQLIINRLTKTKIADVSSPSEEELWLVDPEFTGNKLLATDVNGDIIESSINPSTVGTVKKVNNTSPDANGNVSITTLPSQTGNSGKYLTTNGSNASWGNVNQVADQNSGTLKFWTGTAAQLPSTRDANTLYHITDDTDLTLTLLEAMYPIGSIYIGTMQTCPLQSLGIGTWQLVASDRVLQGAGTRGAVGTTINESLPNITGSFNGRIYATPSGSFYEISPDSWVAGASGNGIGELGFDASRSSSTYQNDAPVQQDAYIVHIWERVS